MMRGVTGVALLFASALAMACPLCMGGGTRSPARDIAVLSHAILATPASDAKSYRVVEVLKGARPEGDVVTDVVIREPASLKGGKPLLLVRDEAWPMWASLGTVGINDAGTLRVVAAKRPADADLDEWRARIDLLLPHLESNEPLLAEIAYAECAAAPYAALRSMKPRLNAPAIRRWLADSRLSTRQSLYLLLLGIAGDGTDAARLGQRLSDAPIAKDATNLGSMLAADLELRGPSRVSWIEATYLRDRSRSKAEIESALSALSVHGNANGAIARGRIIAAYRVFMGAHQESAGLVAQDLASWQYWDAVPDYVALLKSGVRQQYGSRAAIIAYLRQSPGRTAGIDDQ